MTKKAAVILAPGCEEIEALSVVDVLRRLNVKCDMGGLKGAQNLRDSSKLEKLMVKRQKDGKWNAAMCAAPMAFARYGLLDGAKYTMYPGMNDDISSEVDNGSFKEDVVVIDEEKHLVTSRGPATALAYAYAIAEVLGVDTKAIKHGMLYDFLLENN